jgi:hypothetical protein
VGCSVTLLSAIVEARAATFMMKFKIAYIGAQACNQTSTATQLNKNL